MSNIDSSIINNIPIGRNYGDEYLIPIWITNLEKDSSITIELGIRSLPSTIPHSNSLFLQAEIINYDDFDKLIDSMDYRYSYLAALHSFSLVENINSIQAINFKSIIQRLTQEKSVIPFFHFMGMLGLQNNIIMDSIQINKLLDSTLNTLILFDKIFERSQEAYNFFQPIIPMIQPISLSTLRVADNTVCQENSVQLCDPNSFGPPILNTNAFRITGKFCEIRNVEKHICCSENCKFGESKDCKTILEDAFNSYKKERTATFSEDASSSNSCPTIYFGRYHRSTDISVKPNYQLPGWQFTTQIHAVYNGKVTEIIQPKGSKLTKLIIESTICIIENGQVKNVPISIGYLHMRQFSENIQKGTMINKGDFLGYIGENGAPGSVHLHLQIFINSEIIDFSPYMEAFYDTKNTQCAFPRTIQDFCKPKIKNHSNVCFPDPRAPNDPNEKQGLEGIGQKHYIKKDTLLSYNILFENKPTASAAAQKVVVLDTLDITKVDKNRFSFGQLAFGATIVDIPNTVKYNYQKDIDFRPKANCIVRINMSFDTIKGIIKWEFQTINPATNQPTDDPIKGFLPPNINPSDGDGYVSFSIGTKSGLSNETQIKNKASIVFDVNAPIITNEWLNTIDVQAPLSKVNALPTITNDSIFKVSWTGIDIGSQIATYDIYVSVNNGSFTLWKGQTKETSAFYTGFYGSTYRFYSIATDSLGNQETVKSISDAITTLQRGKDCSALNKNIGDICDDGNPNTTNDKIQSNCTCAGTPITNILTLNCPINISVIAAVGQTSAVVNYTTPIATSTCTNGNIKVTPSSTNPTSGTAFPIGTKTLSFTASDGCGNTKTCSFTITVVGNNNPCNGDVTKPITKCKTTTVYLNQSGKATISGSDINNGSTDNCSTALSFAVSPNTFDCSKIGSNTVILTATDAASNNSTCSTIVNVSDNSAPVFSKCPANISLTTTNSCASATWTNPIVTDNCGTPLVSSNYNSGYCFSIGSKSVVYTATDAKGNKATCNFTVTVTAANTCTNVFSSNKCYKIVNKKSGKLLDVYGALKVNNTPIIQWNANNGANQKWRFISVGSGYVKIVAQNSGKEVVCHRTTNNSLVYQYDYAPGGAKDWKIECVNNSGYYKITHRLSGKVLDVKNGSSTDGQNIVISNFNANNNSQLWQIVEVTCPTQTYNLASSTIFDINGQAEFDRNRIGFTTNQGFRTDFFTVEKQEKVSGLFEPLEILNNKQSDNNAQYNTVYDNSPCEGDNFYRVKMTYLSGDFDYSAIQKVVNTQKADFIIFPNPASNEAWIDLKSFEGRSLDIVMSDVAGKVIRHEKVEKTTTIPYRLDLMNIQNGSYTLTIQTRGKRTVVRKLSILK